MRTSNLRTTLSLGGLVAALFLGLAASSASASVGPGWGLDTLAPTNIPAGQNFVTSIQMTNIGDVELNGTVTPIVVSGQLPTGFTLANVEAPNGDFTCLTASDSFECTSESTLPPTTPEGTLLILVVEISVAVGASGPHTVSYSVEGGDPSNPSTVSAETTEITSEAAAFGIKAFDSTPSADLLGSAFTQAGGHPYQDTSFVDFTSRFNPAPLKTNGWPIEPLKDVEVVLPPGFLVDPTVPDTCTLTQLAHMIGPFTPGSLCTPESQVGMIKIRLNPAGYGAAFPKLPIYNMVSPASVPARFAFNILGTVVTFDGKIKSADHYRPAVVIPNTSEGVPVVGSEVTFWGTPASPDHNYERACAEALNFSAKCPTTDPERAMIRIPTSCTPAGEGSAMDVRADSWTNPGVFDESSAITHLPPGYPLPVGQWGAPSGSTDCDLVPFEPTFSAQPTIQRADSPTGLNVEINLPQSEDPETIATSDLRKAVVTLPKGMTVNSGVANGVSSCTEAEIGLNQEGPASCPPASKIGSLEIVSPALDDPIEGAIYLAKQGENPFGSLMAVYFVAEAHGVILKLPAEVSPQTDGQLITTFDEQPQLPFEKLRASFYSGPRATLRTPPSCGTYSTHATLSPWSGNPPSQMSSEFSITSGPDGGACPTGRLDPTLSAGTVNPRAGSFSPFQFRVTRPDASEELSAFTVTLPKGLLGRAAGVPYCPESSLASISAAQGSAAGEIASPHCPAASLLGTVTVGAGAGATPFYLNSGRVYYAGPYKGAPISIVIVTPALAGPFDLGNVVVRAGLQIDPATAQISVVSDPVPAALYGVPLDLRDIRVSIDRAQFTINPTSCDISSVDADITGVSGDRVKRSDRFQLAGCDRLGFKPKLTLRFKGAVHRRAHPRLIADLKARPGDANIAGAQVTLPKAAFLDNAHIGTVCTRVEFASDRCPADSIYGKASATSPLLDYAVSGPVYLRSSNHKLPDLVVALDGPYTQPVEIDLAGKTDSVNGALRNTFEAVPDVPVKKFHLELFGGKRGLVEMSSGFCSQRHATVLLDGQNGSTYDTSPAIKAACGKHRHAAKHRRRQGR